MRKDELACLPCMFQRAPAGDTDLLPIREHASSGGLDVPAAP